MTESDAGLDTGRRTYLERRMLRAVRVVLLMVTMTIQFGVHGYRFLSGEPLYRAELAVYTVLAVMGFAGAALLLVLGRLPAPFQWAGTAVLLGCSVVMSDALGTLDAVQRAEHWSFSVICWHGLVLLFDVPLTWFAAFCAAHVTVTALPLVISGAPVEDLAGMAMTVVAVVGFQFAVAMSALLVRAIAAASARASRAEERLRIRAEAAAAAESNRARRYADLQVATIPLLAGLAGGDLDPRDQTVRRRCAVEAARMRRLFCETDAVDDQLVHELGAVIDIAERHGASVHLVVRGTPVKVSTPVRQDLLTPISEALLASPSEARVTVLYTPDCVRLSVRCAAAALPATRTAGEVELSGSVSCGQLLLETSWQSP